VGDLRAVAYITHHIPPERAASVRSMDIDVSWLQFRRLKTGRDWDDPPWQPAVLYLAPLKGLSKVHVNLSQDWNDRRCTKLGMVTKWVRLLPRSLPQLKGLEVDFNTPGWDTPGWQPLTFKA